jgi:hypothetical protein
MRSDNYFAVFVFFSILGLVATTLFSSIIISQNNKLSYMQENKK